MQRAIVLLTATVRYIPRADNEDGKPHVNSPRILFVTGTDTGVGKTLLTGLLLHHLRRRGVHALAMKPFCSGGRGDVLFLHRVMDGELAPSELNPFYYPDPVAPLVAARKMRQVVRLTEVAEKIQRLAARCEFLLVEGAGGLMVPLGETFTVADLISNINCDTHVVAANRLGAINHTLLTVRALLPLQTTSFAFSGLAEQSAEKRVTRVPELNVTLMNCQAGNRKSLANHLILRQFLHPVPVFVVGYLGRYPKRTEVMKKSEKKLRKTLAAILRMN